MLSASGDKFQSPHSQKYMHKHSARLNITLKCDQTTDVKPSVSNGISHTARYSIIYQDTIIGATSCAMRLEA